MMAASISRRRFLKLAAGAALAGGAGIAGTAYMTDVEPMALSITRLALPLPNLAPAFNGFTIVQISDWHFGDWMNLERMAPVITSVNALQPDVIAVTGDIASHIWADTRLEIIHTVESLQARLGIYAAMGNHDYWSDIRTVRGAMIDGGANVLRNAHDVIEKDGQTLHIVGVNDIWEREHDLDEALRGVPLDAATVLLAHEPDYADEVALTRRIGLQLSGHSHGGQVRLPGKGALILPEWAKKYDQGLYDVGGMSLYVNRGIGMTSPHVRLNCPPEITHITLMSPQI